MGCELSSPQGMFLHGQTKGSAEVTEWKGDFWANASESFCLLFVKL